METAIVKESARKELVQITVDNTTLEVQEGEISVAALKQLAGVPAGYELEEVKNRKLVPLPDNAHLHIKGGEQFVSHPRDGASS